MNTTTSFPTMGIIYRWNRKRLIDTIILYLIHVYRVFNHLTRLLGFSLSSPIRLSVFGQLIIGYKLLRRNKKSKGRLRRTANKAKQTNLKLEIQNDTMTSMYYFVQSTLYKFKYEYDTYISPNSNAESLFCID